MADAGLVDAPHVAWPAFVDQLRWRHDEHVSAIGPTGGGKTTLVLALLPERRITRPYTVVLGTKPRDKVLTRLARSGGFTMAKGLPSHPSHAGERLVLWPRWRSERDTPAQGRAIAHGLDVAFVMGAWCVFADEVAYLCDDLRLAGKLRTWWRQGRSNGLSLVAATQRPSWVPRDLYSAPTHLFFWRTNDDDDLKRISGLNGVSSRVVRQLVANLDGNEALYVNTRTGAMARTLAPIGR